MILPDGWKITALCSVLERIALPVSVEPTREYREIGIRSHGKGIFHKPPVTGESLGEKRVFWVVPDALVLNIVFAWEQAVAVTSTQEAGMIASHRFPMYRPVGNSCDVNFLLQYFKTSRGKELLELASPGGAGRNKTLGQREFERLQVCMPSGSTQKTIAAILAIWDRAVDVVSALVTNSKRHKRGLMQKLLPKLRDHQPIPSNWEIVRLDELVSLNPGRSPRPDDGKVSFLPMAAVSEDGKVIDAHIREYDQVCAGHTAFRNGDILVAKITPSFENGKGALVDGLVNGVGFGSTEFHVLRPKKDVSARLVAHVVNSHEFRRRGESEMEGSAGQRRVAADFIRTFKFACPASPQEQEQIAAVLDMADRMQSAHQDLLKALKSERTFIGQRLLTGKQQLRCGEIAQADIAS